MGLELASKEFVDENAGGSGWTYCGFRAYDYNFTTNTSAPMCGYPSWLKDLFTSATEVEALFPPMLNSDGSIWDGMIDYPMSIEDQKRNKIFEFVKLLDNGQTLLRWNGTTPVTTPYLFFLFGKISGGGFGSFRTQSNYESINGTSNFFGMPYFRAAVRYKLA